VSRSMRCSRWSRLVTLPCIGGAAAAGRSGLRGREDPANRARARRHMRASEYILVHVVYVPHAPAMYTDTHYVLVAYMDEAI